MSRFMRSQGAGTPIDTELETARARLMQLPLGTPPEPGPVPDGSRIKPARNPTFIGRGGDLQRIAAALKAARGVAVTGPDGIGTTDLAVEFAHRYGRYFDGGVFWIGAAMPDQVPLQVAAAGGDCGLRLRADFGELALDDQLHLVLRAWQSETPRLLIFDDCAENGLIREWLPAGGGAHVIVTSQAASLDPGLRLTPVPVGPLGRADSVAFLRQFRPDLPENAPALNAVADELEDQPLALRLAGGFLLRYRDQVGPDAFLRHLRSREVGERSAELTGDPDPARTNPGVPPGVGRQLFGRRRWQSPPAIKAFTLLHGWLQRTDPAGRHTLALLARAACFAPGEPVPPEILAATVETRGEEALDRLIELGLLEQDAAGGVRLHRLLAELIRALPGDPSAEHAAQDAMIAWAQTANDAGESEGRLAAAPHLAHVTRSAGMAPGPAAGLAAAEPEHGLDEREAALCYELGTSLWAAGDLRGARAQIERALEIRERLLGPSDPRTIATLSGLGSLLHAQGDLAGAQATLQRALQLSEATADGDHAETAEILTNLAWTLRYQGDLVGARSALERALELSERTLGPDHPDTVSRLNGLGMLLREQSDLERAKGYLERALDVVERTMGADHPRTLHAINNLGLLLREQGDLDGARTYLQHALTVSQQTLGVDHTDTATALDNMGTLLQAEGDLPAARVHIERALAIRQRTLGPDHPATGTSLNNLGMLLRQLGDLDAARPYLEQALNVSQRELGPYDPQTAASYNNLGMLLLDLGDLYGAQPQLERALAIREQGLGADHPETAASLANVGRMHVAYGDLVGARAYLERALEVREEVLGLEDPLTAATAHDLGTVLRSAGDLAGARRHFERAMAIREQLLGPDHPETLASISAHDEVVADLGGRTSAWPTRPLPDAPYFES
jgi:tetratricopeptide (TPR) repeat protein